jgi:DinB family protein
MAELNQVIASSFATRYAKLGGVVRELAAPLTDEQFWTKPFDFGNSFGHLVLHLTGNLNYYIGTQIAQTGYVRNRPLEFADTSRPSKAEVLRHFDSAIEMVVNTIQAQSADDWSKEYTGVGAEARNRFEILLQCATHLHHHVGQMIYLKFQLQAKG